MYIRERDHISYHRFLQVLRKRNKVSQRRVCEGICTDCAMNRFEKGNRMTEKLMRDRFTARLGISCEKYEDYLLPKEYECWEQRQCIVKAIEKRELEQAKADLDKYALEEKNNCINLQFIDVMRYMILRLEDAPRELLLDTLRNAIKHTVTDVRKAIEGEYLLSDQEINLIAELISLEEAKAERIAEYEKLLIYIEHSCWENMQKVKIYPRIERLICECSQKKEEWSDFCYLYKENECYDMAKVIESRRQMFGFSRKKLTEGICSVRSVVRLERKGVNTSMELVHQIFERLGLCPEYRRTRVLTNDVEVLWLWDEVIQNQKDVDFESWEVNLRKLEASLCMEIPQNKQEIGCLDATLMYRKGEIGKEEFCRRLEEAFEYTLPITALYTEEEKYLTKSERTIIDLLKVEKNGKK